MCSFERIQVHPSTLDLSTFFDHIRYNYPLELANITALVVDDIQAMKYDHTGSMVITTTTGLGYVKMPKLTELKLTELKPVLTLLNITLLGY